MIGTIRKHSQFLWVFIIAGTIIAFVVFFMPGDNPLEFTQKADYGSRYGVPLTREDRIAADRDANLLFMVQYDRFPDPSFPLDRLVEERLAVNALAKLHGIKVSDETMRAWIRLLFTDRATGKPSAQRYDGFLQVLKQRTRFTELDVEEWARNTAAADHLRRIYTQSGKLVSSRAADLFMRYENEQAEAEFVFVPETNYLSKVAYTTHDIATYFTNNIASFRIPERVVVNYVFFDNSNTNYLAEAEKVIAASTNLQTRIDKEYEDRGTNSFRNAEGEVMSKEDAAKKIRQDFVEEEAGKISEDASRVFANEVFKIPDVKTENLFSVAKKMGYEVKESEPFTELDGPTEFDAPGSFAATAFQLSAEEPLTSPIRGVEGIYVIAYNRRVASEIPALTNVMSDVVEEYRNFKADQLLREAGHKIADTIEKGLAAGQLLKDILKTEKLESVTVPPFSRTTRSIPQVETFGITTEEFVTAAMDLEPGSSGQFRSTRNGGYVIYLKKLTSVSDEKVASGLNQFVKDLRLSRQGIVNRAWLDYEDVLSGAYSERQAAEAQRQQREAEAQARAAAEEASN